MRQRLGLCSTIPALVSMAMMAILGLLATAPEPVRADLYCTQFGSSTFRVGSTVKFQWNDTQSVEISSFNLDLYCVQNNQLVTTLMPLNLSSPAVVSWVVDQSFTTLTTNCSAMQFQGAFDWTSTDPTTGVSVASSAPCKVMLFMTGSSAPGSPGGPSEPEPTDDSNPNNIVVSGKTKSIVIGVGCAVGALVLAGIVGFYVIRYSNRRAAEEHMAKKLRAPIQTGPLFGPTDNSQRPGNGGAASRYNELASFTTGSDTVGSPATMNRTEMVEMGPSAPFAAGPAGSHSPTPIAAAHAAKMAELNSQGSRKGSESPVPSLMNAKYPAVAIVAAAAAAASKPGANSQNRSSQNSSYSYTRPPLAAPTAAAVASPLLGSQSPTPISAAHARLVRPSSSSTLNNSTSASYSSQQDRPTSLLTSPFVPVDDTSRSSSPQRNPFEQRSSKEQQQLQEQQQQYEQQLHLQQLQQQQLQQQQQQQQQQSAYGYSY